MRNKTMVTLTKLPLETRLNNKPATNSDKLTKTTKKKAADNYYFYVNKANVKADNLATLRRVLKFDVAASIQS
jgi:hypothetical protein